MFSSTSIIYIQCSMKVFVNTIKVSWVINGWWHRFRIHLLLFFAQPTYCSSVSLIRSENNLKRQSVTEPEPMSSPINYPACVKASSIPVYYSIFNHLRGATNWDVRCYYFLFFYKSQFKENLLRIHKKIISVVERRKVWHFASFYP